MPLVLQSILGLVVLLLIPWALSEHRRHVDWRLPLIGVVVQLGLAATLLALPVLRDALAQVGHAVAALQLATEAGTSLVFGYLGGGPLPFAPSDPGATFVLAFRALPIVLVTSALTALLTYWGIMQRIVGTFAWALERTLGTGGAVGLAVAVNIFVGMIEAPLFIRAYVGRLTRAELFVVMVSGMASIAGTVFALYVAILGQAVPGVAGHLLVASVISAPAAVMVARMMVPEREAPTPGSFTPHPDSTSTMDAVTRGTQAGLQLYLNILGMLIVLVALVSLANMALALLPEIAGGAVTLQRLFGLVAAPVCWLMGIPWAEAPTAGALLATKTVLNELVAYLDLARLPPDALSERSRLIMTYALCGFANFGSVGILIGGLVALAPERRADIVALGFKSLVAGTIATCATGAVIGILHGTVQG